MSCGRVYLVGAGPGDPRLMTARSLELIARADVILYDRLIPATALDGAREDALLIDVGKDGGGGPTVAQSRTQELLIEHSRSGATVVRLKGGDPFVFGRGGEEALGLREAGIAYEIVPGITAGIAAPAYAGIPVTHRDRASAVAFVTGHEDPGKPDAALDWSALAAFPGTLVFYMGVAQLEHIARSLIDNGRDPAQAAAIIERGTLPGQRTITGSLGSISERATAEHVVAPAVTVVGPVAGLAADLAWRQQPPLSGITVAVTRARAQASGLALALGELGATVVQTPVIRIERLPGPAPDLAPYDLLCMTSPNGVRLLFERLRAEGRDARALSGLVVAAIGPGTAGALADHGVLADIVPERFVAEGLIEALAERPISRALIATAQSARETLPDALRERGADVDVLALYRTVAEPIDPGTRARAAGADYITFTSSSTVSFFLEAAGAEPALSDAARIVSIGPLTSATLREHGLQPHVEAAEHDIDGLVAALLADVAGRRVDR